MICCKELRIRISSKLLTIIGTDILLDYREFNARLHYPPSTSLITDVAISLGYSNGCVVRQDMIARAESAEILDGSNIPMSRYGSGQPKLLPVTALSKLTKVIDTRSNGHDFSYKRSASFGH